MKHEGWINLYAASAGDLGVMAGWHVHGSLDKALEHIARTKRDQKIEPVCPPVRIEWETASDS